MKVIVAGSRTLDDPWLIVDAVRNSKLDVTEVVSGHARGIDKTAEQWAFDWEVDLTVFHANWAKYRNAAGVIRNAKMAEYADALIAIWDGESKGTKHMIETMEALGKPVYVYKTDNDGSTGH